MSFSSLAKQELCRLEELRDCCALAELAALLHGCAALHLGREGWRLSLSTESPAVARRTALLLKHVFLVSPQLNTLQRRRLGRSKVYRLTLGPGPEVLQILLKTGLMRQSEEGLTFARAVPGSILRRSCCRYAYMRGAFLATGYLNDPEKGYHLEICGTDAEYAASLCRWLNRQGLRARVVSRKEVQVVYIKDSEQIVTFLSMVGAHKALLEMENVRVEKDMRNRVNRIVNCEQANIEKTLSASQRQVEAIQDLERLGGLRRLSPALLKTAELRLEYPDATLQELGEYFSPPVGKSAVNHRLRKLEQLACEWKEKLGEE